MMRLAFLLVFYTKYFTESRIFQDVVYVSRLRGHAQRDSCGLRSLPCKFLQDGIDKTACGGQLYVDGEHSTVDPYKCESTGGKLTAERSLFIQSYTTTARISCRFGFHILPMDTSIGIRNVSITGVEFMNTALYIRNTNITIHGCIFLESSPAIDIKNTIELPLYSLDIKNSVFERNHECITLFQGDVDHNSRCARTNLKLENVVFRENTAYKGGILKGGLVFVRHQSCHCKGVSFFSVWENVTAIRNIVKKQVFEDNRYQKGLLSYPTKDYVVKHSSKESKKRDLILDSLFVIYTCSANITLNKVASVNNSNMRYLGLQCCYSHVRISKSTFDRHIISGPGGVVYIPKGEVIDLAIKDSNFTANAGSIGGALQIDGGTKKTVILDLYNVIFRYNHGNVTGCTVSVGSITKQGVGKIFANLHGAVFDQCHSHIKRGQARFKHGPLCLQATRLTYVSIRDSIFRNNKNRKAAAVHILHSPRVHNGSTLDVRIVRTQFDQNTCDTSKPTLGIFLKYPTLVKKSILTITDTVFTRNKGRAITVDNIQDIKFLNITCKYTKGLCYSFYIGKRKDLKNTPPGLNVTFFIENSTFSNNYQSFVIKYVQPNFVDIQIRNVIVQENTRGGQAFLQFGSRRLQNLKITGRVLFDRFHFISNTKEGDSNPHLFSVVVPKDHDGNISFVFRRSEFKSNFHQNTKINLHVPDTLLFFQTPHDKLYANKSLSKCSEFPAFHYKNIFIFEEVIFEDNIGPSFIAYVANGKSLFHQCMFKNNYSHKPLTGAYLFIQEGTASVEFRDTNFIQEGVTSRPIKSKSHDYHDRRSLVRFLFLGARGPLLIRNSSFVGNDSSERVVPHLTVQTDGYVYIDNQTTLMCPVGSYMNLEDGSRMVDYDSYGCIKITRLEFICKMCDEGKYSLEQGSYQGMLKKPITCIKSCPFGADCTWNIHSRPNFWGYQTSEDPPRLNFTRCPEKYCHVPRTETNTSVYNTCSGNRTGVMCGACKEGFTESIFNYKCRPIHECKDGWFWAIAGLYSIIIAWYLLCRPSIVSCLMNSLMWFRRKKTSTTRLADANKKADEYEQTTTTVGEGGYSKIIFYFYQVADLLMLDSSSEIIQQEQVFIVTLVSLYNFQVDMADSSFGCPFPGLTAVTKELFRCLQVFCVMLFIVVFYFLHWFLWAIRKRPRPLLAPYLAAIIKVLLLGYERLGHTSLKLLNCAPLNMLGKVEWRLVLDGNITCWVHWWQYVMIAYNVVFVVPFLLVLLVGTSKLQRQEISGWQFVASCFLPLPFLVHWLLRRVLKSYSNYGKTGDQTLPIELQALLDVLQGPFRPPDGQSRGACYWESILIGRRLVLLCLYSFIPTPMHRMIFMSAVCIAILVHTIIIRPYKDNKVNIFSVTLLSMHIALAIINLCKSVLITVGVNPTGPTKEQIHGFQIFEVSLLGALPFSFLILVLATILSKFVQILFFISQYLVKKCIKEDERILDINTQHDDCHQPLLSPNVEYSLPYSER